MAESWLARKPMGFCCTLSYGSPAFLSAKNACGRGLPAGKHVRHCLSKINALLCDSIRATQYPPPARFLPKTAFCDMTKDNNEVFYVRSQSSDHPLFD